MVNVAFYISFSFLLSLTFYIVNDLRKSNNHLIPMNIVKFVEMRLVTFRPLLGLLS